MTTINPNINVQNTNGAQNINSQNGSSGQNTANSAANTDFMKKTSENDLVEFDENGNNTNAAANTTGANANTAANSGATVVPTTTTTINPTAASTIDTLQMQQESLTKQLEQLNKRLENVQKRYKSAQTQLSKAKALGKNTDKINEVISSISSSISEINSKISQCISSLNSISGQMTQAINSLYTTTTTNAVANTGTAAVNGTANTTGTANVNSAAAGNISGVNYDTQKAQALADAATELHGNNPYSGGMCGSGVTESIQKAFGVGIYGNGCDFRDLLRGRSDWVEVTDSFPTVESLDNLPAGAVVSWQPYNTTSAGNTYGHVFIADGKGNEISDFCAPMNNAHYADGGSWSVFLPA